jgi:hypothetical protein
MKNSLLVLWACLLSTVCPGAESKNTVPGVPFDLQWFINKEIQSGNQWIVVPPGRYRGAPKDRQHLLLHNLRDPVPFNEDGSARYFTPSTNRVQIEARTQTRP